MTVIIALLLSFYEPVIAYDNTKIRCRADVECGGGECWTGVCKVGGYCVGHYTCV